MITALFLLAFTSAQPAAAPAIERPRPAIDSGDRPLAEFRFLTPGCWPTGSAMGTKGQTVTVVRAGTRTCNIAALGAAPQIVTCQANEACVEAQGLLVEPGRTNLGLWSNGGWAGSWTSCTGPCTNNVAIDPSGAGSAVRITITGASEVYNNAAVGSAVNNRTFTSSVFCRSSTGTPQEFYLGMTDAASWAAGHAGQIRCSIPASGYARCGKTLTYTAAGASTTAAITIGTTDHGYGTGNIASFDVQCWGYQIEESAYATSYIPTAGTSAARAADVVSIVNPLAATNPATWCVEGTFTPESGRAWGAVASARLASSYTGTATNIFILSESGWSSTVSWDTYGADSASKRLVSSPAWAAGSAHRIQAGSGPALKFDGADAGTSGGTGTGVFTSQGANIGLGGPLSGDTGVPQAGIYIQNFKVRKGVCK